jgi:chromosome segregation ATPase
LLCGSLQLEYAHIEDYAHELQIQNDELQTKQLTLITELNTFKNDCLHFQQYSQELKTHNEILQTDLETLENTQRTLDDENHHFSEKIRKLETIVVSERKLRKLFEEKTKIALQQAYTSELARQQEEQAKKASEEKTRRALDQAGKAMMHFISDGLQTQLTSSYDHAS